MGLLPLCRLPVTMDRFRTVVFFLAIAAVIAASVAMILLGDGSCDTRDCYWR